MTPAELTALEAELRDIENDDDLGPGTQDVRNALRKAIDAIADLRRKMDAETVKGHGPWVRYSDYARLQEQLAAQIDGHQLTAKEATANLLRANRIEAGLEEMTRSCLAERAGRLAAEAERDRLREALQAMLSNPDKVSRAQARAALQKEPQP